MNTLTNTTTNTSEVEKLLNDSDFMADALSHASGELCNSESFFNSVEYRLDRELTDEEREILDSFWDEHSENHMNEIVENLINNFSEDLEFEISSEHVIEALKRNDIESLDDLIFASEYNSDYILDIEKEIIIAYLKETYELDRVDALEVYRIYEICKIYHLNIKVIVELFNELKGDYSDSYLEEIVEYYLNTDSVTTIKEAIKFVNKRRNKR